MKNVSEKQEKLIAAAPELLEALEGFVILYKQGQLVLEGDEDGNDPLVALAIKAITKAKGLKPYMVSLRENKGDAHFGVFYCLAEDTDHADDQAIDAYPNCELINTIECSNLDALESFMVFYKQGQLVIEGDDGNDPVVAAALAAIAKATGKN